MSEKKDPGFVADIMASDNEKMQRLLRLFGCIEMPAVCQHTWEGGVFFNGAEEFVCQNCGEKR